MAFSRSFAIDTSTFSLLMRGDEGIRDLVGTARSVAMPIVVVAEVRAGFLHGQIAPKYRRILDDFLSDPHITVLQITDETVPVYAELYAYARSNGRQLSNNDLWIAALCIQYNYPLCTHDKDFDALPQIRRVRD